MGKVPYSVAFTLLMVALEALALEDSCLLTNDDPYLLFGPRTAYNFVYNGKYSRSKIHDIPGCRAIAIWMVARYGSQVPPAEEIVNFQNLDTIKRNIVENYGNRNYRETGLRMCPADLDLLDRWTWNPFHNLSRAGDLTLDGYRDLRQLAQTWRHKFPELFTNNQYDYLFKFGKDYSASTSFRAFSEGLLGQRAESIDIPREIDDSFLKPHKDCPAWTNLADYNNTYSQLRTFESKAEYRTMISNVSRRMGYNYDVDPAIVKSAYRMCAYNKAWNVGAHSAWCTVFSKEDLQRLEYGEDLDAYNKFGYGSALYEKLGCPVVKDLMNFFNIQVQPNELPQQPRTRVYLTDADGLLITYAALGLNRDLTPLTGDNYHGSLIQKRKWRTSYMAPYTGNIAVVLYKCDPDSPSAARQPEFKVLFLGNEQPIQIDDCRVGLCSWDTVTNSMFRDTLCSSDYCSRGHALHLSALALVLALLVVLKL